MNSPVWLTSLLALSVGCAGGSSSSASSSWQDGKGVTNASSGTEAERWFPMKDGTLYHYRTVVLGDTATDAGMLMMKMVRTGATTGELRKPTGTQTFELTAGGVATKTKTGAPAFLLKLPVDANAQWLGPQGGVTKIGRTGLSVTVPAGTYANCLTTEEARGGDAPIRIVTTLCPDVGIVSLEVQAGAGVERAELMYFGPPVLIGTEGVQRVE